MEIHVTQEDIDKGKQGKPSTCAIARAVRRQSGYLSVQVDGDSIEVGGDEYKTPTEAAGFIDKFDDDKKSVRPFSFFIEGLEANTRSIIKKIVSPFQVTPSPIQMEAREKVVARQ